MTAKLEKISFEAEALTVMDWIPLKRYTDLSGESRAAVRKRISVGAWKRGKQFSTPHGAGIWVSLAGVREWAARDVHDLRQGLI